MNHETRQSVVGAVVVLALALALSFSYGGGDLKATDDLAVIAKFNRVDGLAEGDDVRLGGIKVGVVDTLALDDRFQAVLTFRLAPGIQLPLDTSAAIHTDGLFGRKFVVLEPGGEIDMLEPGDEITFTQDAVVVGDLLELIINEGKSARKAKAAQ